MRVTLASNEQSSYTKKNTSWLSEDGRRQRGRPRSGWTISMSMRSGGIAKDKEQWRNLEHTKAQQWDTVDY